jgi:hypothetical protein
MRVVNGCAGFLFKWAAVTVRARVAMAVPVRKELQQPFGVSVDGSDDMRRVRDGGFYLMVV